MDFGPASQVVTDTTDRRNLGASSLQLVADVTAEETGAPSDHYGGGAKVH
jgi:hypothetical protein